MYKKIDIFKLISNALKKSGEEISDIELFRVVDEVISKVVPEIADLLLKDLKSKSSGMLNERRRYERGFEKRLAQRWKKAIDLLEMFLVIACEAGEEFNQEYREEASVKNDYVFDVLTRMHARSCLIGFEMLSLLKSGFADGAHARWRTLHEIVVISYFIKEHGQDIAKRFLDFEIVESYLQARAYKEHRRELGYKPLSDFDWKEIKENYDKICKEYGKDFGSYPYGWIPKNVLKKKTFSEIEKSVKLDRLRPYYNMACYNIHAGPKGILFKLGLIKTSEVLLAGPSNYGLADPGQGLAISLHQITTCLLSTKPTTMSLIVTTIMQTLVDQICKAFCEVQFEIEDEEKKELSP